MTRTTSCSGAVSYTHLDVYKRQQYDVQGLAGEDTQERGAGQLRENLRQAVRRLVEAAVANDRRNLQITELSDPELLRKLKNEQDYYCLLYTSRCV